MIIEAVPTEIVLAGELPAAASDAASVILSTRMCWQVAVEILLPEKAFTAVMARQFFVPMNTLVMTIHRRHG